MSVIAWDGKTVAADRQATEAGIKTFCKKLHVFRKTGDIIGSVGDYDTSIALENWYKSGADPKKFPKHKSDGSKLIVFKRSGEVIEYEGTSHPHSLKGKFFAWGSGGDIAIGAMAMGATASQAVRVTCTHHVECGMGVTAYRIVRK